MNYHKMDTPVNHHQSHKIERYQYLEAFFMSFPIPTCLPCNTIP